MNKAHFPEVKGKNLEGKNLRLPQDLEGELNLVFLAFQREQHLMLNTWLPTADLLESIHQELKHYELPTVSRMNPLIRWFINTGLRYGIKDPKYRRKTITLYLDKEPFRKELDLGGEDNIYILLMDRKGTVVWKSEGSCNVEKAKNLSDFIESYL